MDWTVGTFWTLGNDSRRIGLIGDWLDSWERRRPGGTPRQASEFHCLFGPSQLRRLGPKRPRNTSVVAVVPRAALRLRRRLPWAGMFRAFSASAASRRKCATRKGCLAEQVPWIP